MGSTQLRLRPVLLGTDLGIYAMARSFHETYGVPSIVVSEEPRGPINDSAILRNVFTGRDTSEESLVATLESIADEDAAADNILVVNSDHQLDFLLRHRQRLAKKFIIPFDTADKVRQLADKRAMYEVLRDLQIAFPATRDVLPARGRDHWLAQAQGLTYPLVMKPFAGAQFEELTFAGHRKVYRIDSSEELCLELSRIAAAGYEGAMLLQEMVLGDDTANYVVNVYRDRRGKLTMAASGRVLLAMHQPRFIGNSAIIMLDYREDLIAQVQRVLDQVNFRGFASIDFKVDPRTARANLLDINPRLGRSHYYAGVGGASAARSLVADFVLDEPLETQRARREGIYAYIPTFVLGRYVRDPQLLSEARRVLRKRRGVHPLGYRNDRNVRRWWYRILAQVNQLRGLWRFYRKPTSDGF